jgi:hypothetical protein
LRRSRWRHQESSFLPRLPKQGGPQGVRAKAVTWWAGRFGIDNKRRRSLGHRDKKT